jgi:hypothetical protein
MRRGFTRKHPWAKRSRECEGGRYDAVDEGGQTRTGKVAGIARSRKQEARRLGSLTCCASSEGLRRGHVEPRRLEPKSVPCLNLALSRGSMVASTGCELYLSRRRIRGSDLERSRPLICGNRAGKLRVATIERYRFLGGLFFNAGTTSGVLRAFAPISLMRFFFDLLMRQAGAQARGSDGDRP